ncbi:MAG: hypothetical protein ACFFB3_15900 [Candidatus Hodarchaeota archaeon]
MTTTPLADLVDEISIKSGLTKDEIRRWAMTLQKSHPSHPTVERAAAMIASVFGIPKEPSESAIRNQQALDVFIKVKELKKGTKKEKNGKSSIKGSKSAIDSSQPLIKIAEEELQRLTRFLSYLEETVRNQS